MIPYKLGLSANPRDIYTFFYDRSLTFNDNLVQAIRYLELTENFRDAVKLVDKYTFILYKPPLFEIDLRNCAGWKKLVVEGATLLIRKYPEPEPVMQTPPPQITNNSTTGISDQ